MGAFAPGLMGGGGGGLGLAAAGLGGLGLLGALGGGGGGGGGSGGGGTPTPTTPTPTPTPTPTTPTIPTRIPPAVNDPATSKDISTVTPDKIVEVTGTGEPGETVVVTVGDKTQTTTITEDGKWETKFEGPNFPGDGTHEAVVTVTPGNGGPTEVLDGPSFVIDLTPPPVSTTAGTVSVGDVENLSEYADGVTVKGEGEPGATILVTVTGTTNSQPATVGTDGTWEVTFTDTQITGGDFKEIPITITATDGMGNTTTIKDSIAIDTVPHTLGFNTIAGDNVVSKLESDGTVTVSGTVSGASSSNAEVTITLNGVQGSKTVTAVNGTWTTSYPAGTFSGNNERTFTATTTDAAGNVTANVTKTITVDTTATVNFTAGNLPGDVNGTNGLGDGKLNATETTNGVTMTGKAEVGSQSVTVVWNGYTKTLTAGEIDSNGNWSVNFAKSEMPVQPTNAAITSTATVTAIDQYGNQSPIDTKTVTIDTKTSVTFDANQSGGDNIISSSEAGNNVKLTGTAESGASVEVTYRGVPHTVIAGTDGKWEATFTTAELDVGGMQNGVWANGVTDMTSGSATQVQVRATDGAGNIVSTTGNVQIDTETSVTAGTNTYNTDNTVQADNILNEAEALNGLVVTGTAEAGSTITLTFGNDYSTEFKITGTTWSHTIPVGSIPGGNAYGTADGGATEAKLTITSKDEYGNISAPYSEVIDIDRIVTPFTNSGLIGGDGTVNATEAAAGLVLTGTGELGADVKVIVTNNGGTAFNFTSDSVAVGANGTWSITLDATQLPDVDNQKYTFTLQATDEAGNIRDIPLDNITIDTVAPEASNVRFILDSTSQSEGMGGVILADNITSDYSFHRVTDDGMSTQLQTTPEGLRSVEFNGNGVPEGDYLVINQQDAAGNSSATLVVSSNTGEVSVDVDNAAFQKFDFTTIDLTLAPAKMSISIEDLIAMTGPGNTLLIKGGGDDQVALENASAGSKPTGTPDGFTLYTLGDSGASVYLDDDIQRPNF